MTGLIHAVYVWGLVVLAVLVAAIMAGVPYIWRC